ncbi:MAG: hypothetical protein Q9191_004451 [Dirinaria sp. TL-2023a]
MSQETEPSLSEYARFHGLSIYHLDYNPLSGLSKESILQSHLKDPDRCFKIDSSLDVNLEERLQFGEDEALVLASLAENPRKIFAFDQDLEIDTHRVRNMKVEVPMLTTDHEIDMLHFASPLVPDLAHEHLPFESVDDEADQGLFWPSQLYRLPDEYMTEAEKEQLEISKDDLMSMHETLHSKANEEEGLVFDPGDTTYKRPLTPPLLPLSPIYLPYEPSSDTGHLEILSNPSSPTLKELNDIERRVFREDINTKNEHDLVTTAKAAEAVLTDYENIGEIYSPLKGIEEPPSSPPIRKPPHRDSKVEVPMTPPHSDLPPPWNRKSASFKDALHEVIHKMPSPLPKPKGPSSEGIDEFVASSIAPVAAQTERSIEQEQLQEADTTHRVAVPVMDFSLPIAPWKVSLGSAPLKQSQVIRPNLVELKHSQLLKHCWPKSGSTGTSLQWMPFPAALGRVETYESITDDQVLDDFLSQPECVDGNTLTWKREGLRIFDSPEDEEDEEMPEGVFPSETDIGSLLHKRRLELEQLNDLDKQDGSDSDPYEPLGKPVNHEAFRKVPRLSPRVTSSKAEATTSEEPQIKGTEKQSDVFSARESLENFMSIRNQGAKRSGLTARKYFPVKQNELQTNTETMKEEPKVPAKHLEATPSLGISAVATPEFDVPHESTPFVVSTSFLLHRKLAQQVQRLYPSAEFIERDFSLHSAQSEKGTGKVDESASNAVTMRDEADIIVSPSTGLVLTTLQKIKQRALPGQASKAAIRERIERIAMRYERLVVLVSSNSMEELQSDTFSPVVRILDEKDCEALVDFNAFCLGIHEEIQVIFTAGDAETLAKWIVGLMIKHGYANGQMKLLQEETLWEIFLRRAGFNAFAAQAILAELKGPDTSNFEKESRDSAAYFGLAAFIRMSLQERAHRFERLLGGRNLIESYSLHESSTTLFLTSLRQLPIRLYSPFAPTKVASYPLVSPTTEAFIAPHSLEFSLENPNHLYTGSESCISTFDIQRDGEGPFERRYTTPSRRGTADGRVGMKGIVSALAGNADRILAAGTFTRWIGLCDARGGVGDIPAVFPLDGDKKRPEGGVGQGTGITQLLWSSCARYLCVTERNSDGIGVWDIRGSGQRLAWLKGRKALTPQRLGVEVVGGEVWAGGTDGKIRAWEQLGASEGIIEPGWEFHAHEDAVCAKRGQVRNKTRTSCHAKRVRQAEQSTALKSIKSLAPLLDRVLVQRVKAEAKTKGGLFLPESSVKELNEATVLAVGPGGLDKEGKRVTPSVAPGDKVLIPQYGGSPVVVQEEEYTLFRDHELLAKIKE